MVSHSGRWVAGSGWTLYFHAMSGGAETIMLSIRPVFKEVNAGKG